jgi:hypothetical protein
LGDRTFATASQLQEILFHKAIEHTLLRSKGGERSHHNNFTRAFLINKYVKALRKCVLDVEVDQFSPKQRRLYIFYGQGQSRPAHHTHMAQLIIINFYVRHCKQNDLPVGDTAEFQEFMMEFYGARPYRPSSSAPLTIFTINTGLVNVARRRGVETPDHGEFCKQFRDNRIELVLEKHNLQYLKNQRRSPVKTRFSNSYYVYSQPATPDEVPGKQKRARLSGRFPGTSVKKTEPPAKPSRTSEPALPSRISRTSQRRNKRKKIRADQFIVHGTTVSSSILSSADTEGEEIIPETRSGPRKPTSVSRAVSVAIPITQEDDDPRRRSARIESKDPISSLTRSESVRRWRVFKRGITDSEATRAWREHIRNFYAEQEAKLKMAEEAKSKKQ